MKYQQYSFLFLHVFVLVIACCVPNTLVSQTSYDSIHYHYNAILNPEQPESLSAGMNFYNRKKITDLANHDTLAAISDLRLLAIGEFKIGNNYDSENYIVEALDLIAKLKHKDTLINAQVGLYNTLGRIYRASNNENAALEAFEKGLAITNKLKDSIIILNNKANIYKSAEKYELALKAYQLSLNKAQKANKPSQLALVLDNIGAVQMKLGSTEALENLESALKIRTEGRFLNGMYASYHNLSDYWLAQNDQEKAKHYAQKALQFAQNINSSSFKLDALSLFINLEENPTAKEYKRLTDSIATAKQIASNKNAYLKFNVAQEQKKAEASKLLHEQESKKRLRYQFLLVLALLLFLASYFIFRYRRKQANIVAVYDTETRIAKKVHDEVANDLYQVMNALESSNEQNGPLLDEMEKIYNKTRDISRENRTLDVSDNFENLLNDLFFSFKSNQVQIVTRNLSKINWQSVAEMKKRTIYRVLQELLTNMKKHSQASSVALVFAKNGKKVQINYSDNGVGSELKHKNGLQITESRIASVNGKISFESNTNKGFKATIIV